MAEEKTSPVDGRFFGPIPPQLRHNVLGRLAVNEPEGGTMSDGLLNEEFVEEDDIVDVTETDAEIIDIAESAEDDGIEEVVFGEDEVGVLSPLPAQPNMTEETVVKRTTDRVVIAARGAGHRLYDGFDSIRKVRAAAKLHSNAKQELKTMRTAFDTDSAELRRRDGIIASYVQIVEEETAELSEATELVANLRDRKSALTDERTGLQAELSREKSDNEQFLRPYKQLSDTARGRSEDASRAVAEAKRTVKSQENKVGEAQNRRTQSIASANRELDNSQDRLRRMQDELAKLKAESNPEEGSITSLEADIVSETARIESARAKVSSVTSESQAEVDRENERLFALRRSLDQASSDADAAKQEYEDRRGEYERLSNEASAREQAIQADIDSRSQDISTTESEISAAEARIRDATAILDDANDIHDHPEVTEALRESVEAQRNAMEEQTNRITELATTEHDLRQSTRTNRIIFIAASVVLVLIVIAIIVAVIMSGK